MEFNMKIPAELETGNILNEMWSQFSYRFHQNKMSSEMQNSSTPSLLLFAGQHKIDQISLDLGERGISPAVTNEVLQVVEEICLPYFLLLFERFRFFVRKQNSSESASDFAQGLRQQIKLCQFSELQENLLISAFISGISDENLRQKLQKMLEISNISFDDAVNLSNTTAGVEQAIESTDLGPIISPIVKKRRGRKRKPKVQHNGKESKMCIMPVDNDDHEDVDLDDAKLVINKLKIISKRKKGKLLKKILPARGKTRPKIYKCFACSNEYCTRKSFQRHVKAKHTGIRKFHCVHCNLKFETLRECVTHCRGHRLSFSAQDKSHQGYTKSVADQSYICWHCGETQANLAEYREHCTKHSAAVRVYTCDICQKKNHNITRLIGHLKGHLVPRHKCEICGNCFGRPELLLTHMQTHVDHPNHHCTLCNKSFVTADRLQCHIRTHSGEKRFTCELCGKSFSQKMSFDYHKRWHAGEKPYECDICGRRTICFGDLKKHKRMHSDKRPYVCEVCGKSFRFISNLNRHRKGHTGKRLYVCQICGRSFIYNEGLRDHIKAGRCPGMKSETGNGVKLSNRGPRPRNSNAVVSVSMMNLMDGSSSITAEPQQPLQLQVQSDYPSSYITKAMLNPVNLSNNNLAPGLLQAVPACSLSPSTIASHQKQQSQTQSHTQSHQQHESTLIPSSRAFVQVSAPSQYASAQQLISQPDGTVTCSLPEYMSDFTTWPPQYVIRNNVTVSEGSEVGQPGTNVVIVPQFY